MTTEDELEQIRADGYVSGRRLRGVRAPLQKYLAEFYDWSFLGADVEARAQAYVKGFVDGWELTPDPILLSAEGGTLTT